ncbi:multidrug efflux SMR transporter [Algiphilus sp.]|uniref:DMT family transporter n=1 Tax=Algiphilus sp. TaxID=1872431 RepID=UPI001CA70E29|nr:multidrug efflux SMR transporter [Algiphilus sp.]MBY8964319.1 multidrug efflux SMR transporter [Algiphilus acroporae]MCI5063797.1 multidrug efflux SMR transporter [Algiphilus sp.]MCI5104336.1 multidrug efflux SMR transporter [Algiphilus sp.]MCR9089827.1 multidrug efflux SMR transporter [Pseudomonadota bacterium]
MMHWLFLGLAIVCEVIATTALRATDGFTRLVPSLIVVFGYGFAFYFLSLTLRVIPVGVAYAIWCGAGLALIALIGWVLMGQKLDAAALTGIVFITLGVAIIFRYSNTVAH